MAEAQSRAIAVVLSVSLSVSVGLSVSLCLSLSLSLSAADRLQPHPSLSRGTLPSAPWVRIGGTRSVLPAGPTAPPRGSRLRRLVVHPDPSAARAAAALFRESLTRSRTEDSQTVGSVDSIYESVSSTTAPA